MSINREDPFKPILAFDKSRDSQRAREALDNAGIEYDLWDVTVYKRRPNEPVPFLLRGKKAYYGLEQIQAFIREYPRILKAENAIRKVAV